MKRGKFDCKELREFHRRQACSGCGQPADDPQHYPTRGAGGDDFGCFPACRPCHGKMQRYEGGFTHLWQTKAAADALLHFLRRANESERKAFVESWKKYAEARVFMEIAS
jgi:hypothetical protein